MADKSAREFAIQSALKDYESGVYSTQSAAARAYNIPQKTFTSRLNGSTNARIGREQQQRLTQEQEEFLVGGAVAPPTSLAGMEVVYMCY